MRLQRILAALFVVLAVLAAVYLMIPVGNSTNTEPYVPDTGEVTVLDPTTGNEIGGTENSGDTEEPSQHGGDLLELVPNTPDNSFGAVEYGGYTQEDLENLTGLDHFRDSTIEHLFLGTINDSGKATGYHYDGIIDSPGEIIEGTKSEPDSFGVYTAKVRVNGINKSGNKGYSSFFPEYMSPQDVIDAINEAYENRVDIGDGLYAGLTDEGMEIDMVLTKKGIIVTAYPVKEGD